MISENRYQEHHHEDNCESREYDERNPDIVNIFHRLAKSLQPSTEICDIRSSFKKITEFLNTSPENLRINTLQGHYYDIW
jgi:hypothetical protein